MYLVSMWNNLQNIHIMGICRDKALKDVWQSNKSNIMGASENCGSIVTFTVYCEVSNIA